MRNLVTGAVSPELDTQMAEGVQITGTQETPEIAAARNRCRVGQISLYDGPLSEFGVSRLCQFLLEVVIKEILNISLARVGYFPALSINYL